MTIPASPALPPAVVPVSAPAVAADGTWALPAGEGPCRTWPLDPLCGCLPTSEQDPPQPPPPGPPTNQSPLQRSSIETATEILWRLTAGVYGLCQDLIRPCRRTCTPINPHRAGPWPALIDGQWVNLYCACTQPSDRCGCGGVDELQLPGPVHTTPDGLYPIEVWIDGRQLAATEYRYAGGNRLVRANGQRWPLCQDTTQPIIAPGTWGIRYWHGNPVPAGGRRAVAILACELAKACANDPSCQLPIAVTEVVREGVTYRVINKMEFLKEGRVGLFEVDLWVRTANPHRLASPPQVYSVDLPSFLVDPTQPASSAPGVPPRPGTIDIW